MTSATLPDRRSPAFPNEPYSAYCRVCWSPVYALWIDNGENPRGKCQFGHAVATQCEDAMNAAHNKASVIKARQALGGGEQ